MLEPFKLPRLVSFVVSVRVFQKFFNSLVRFRLFMGSTKSIRDQLHGQTGSSSALQESAGNVGGHREGHKFKPTLYTGSGSDKGICSSQLHLLICMIF